MPGIPLLSLDDTLLQLEAHRHALELGHVSRDEWHRRVILTLLQRYPDDLQLRARLATLPDESHREPRTSTSTGTRPLAAA